MKTIYLKGGRKGVIVSDEVGTQIAKAKSVGTQGWLDLDGWSGELSDVKSVFDGVDEDNREMYKARISENLKEENDKFQKQTQTYYEKDIEKMSYMSPEFKSKKMDMAKFFNFAYCKKFELPRDMEIEIEKRQLDFFKENPRYPYADPKCYKDLFKKDDLKDTNIESLSRGGSINVAVRLIVEATQTARDLKLII